uniref:(northern house mosquito) hypothetical protein n=1 Tax=Culex pipiens TaxID=7175 RepID=A0A8D8F0A4_CULPI
MLIEMVINKTVLHLRVLHNGSRLPVEDGQVYLKSTYSAYTEGIMSELEYALVISRNPSRCSGCLMSEEILEFCNSKGRVAQVGASSIQISWKIKFELFLMNPF